jgi:hypothetical protein
MGFVVPSKVPCLPHHPGDASTGEHFTVEPELGLGVPLPESPRQAVAAGADGIPSVVHSLARCINRLGELAAAGATSEAEAKGEAESPSHAFSAGRGNPPSRPDRAAAEAVVEGLGGATGVCPESTVVMSGSAMPPGGVAHPRVGSFTRAAPQGSSPTFMGSFNVKERSEERLLGCVSRRSGKVPGLEAFNHNRYVLNVAALLVQATAYS